ncbi:SOS response-associated peptidase [Actinacidiphila soli]|jgi:putative SOS response-associated peptidase YedK|uniref:SOS response-associated peptidase n=1 Tax=Actinacidiphila soli TaxID=2487275 RepID=UPI000FCAFF54|nr:SOS response-associated peptidase [Actinacidiphila soli]
MCGRYAASRRPEDLVGLFEVRQWDPEEALAPNWNVAPTDTTYAVLERPDKETGEVVRQLRAMRWGLVPGWAKSPDVGVKMINARAETVHEKASFRRPFVSRRCLLPADGYYEWVTAPEERQLEEQGKKKRPRKQPYFVTPVDGSVMAMAGLYEFWRDRTLPDDHERAWWVTCTVITTAADTAPFAEPAPDDRPRSLADIHPRMPLMLTPDRWDDWLSPSRTDALLTPPPAGLLRAYPVRTDVSNVRNDGPELVEPLPAPEEQTLF